MKSAIRNPQSETELVVARAVEAPRVPGWVQLMPWGEFSVNGNAIRYTDESIPLIEARLAEQGVELPLDYDHAMSTNPPANGIAPAAGWIKRLELRSGQPLRAEVSWTPQAARHIEAREFRYLSPTFFRRKDDGVVIGLHSVALTNKPAIAHMPPIAAREALASAADAAAERIAAMKSIAQCLGLAAEATEEQITAKCKELLTAAAEAPPLRAAVAAFAAEVKDDGLKALAATGQVELISAGLKTAALKLQNPPGMVAKADYEALAAQVKTLQDEQARQQCSALIAAHAQQLPPAKEEWFRKFYAADPVAAKEWIEQAPELVSRQPAAGTTTPGAGGDRQALITSARAKVRAEPGVLWGGRTEREFVNGQLLAGGQKGLTDDEAVKLGL